MAPPGVGVSAWLAGLIPTISDKSTYLGRLLGKGDAAALDSGSGSHPAWRARQATRTNAFT